MTDDNVSSASVSSFTALQQQESVTDHSSVSMSIHTDLLWFHSWQWRL